MRPRAVFLDMSMPRMGGRGVLRAIDDSLPILFTTGYDPKEAEPLTDHPSTGFPQKPGRRVDLVRAIEELLSQSPPA